MFFFLRDKYQSFVGHMSRGQSSAILLSFVLIVVAMGFLFQRMPTSYLPDEDQGILMVQVQLPPGSTREQTDVVLEKVRRHFLEDQKDAVESCMTVTGMSLAGTGQNQGLAFVKLKDWKLRDRPNLRAKAVAGKAMEAFSGIRNAVVFAFPPPAVVELGTIDGI